jgi:dephospho-CoA kinase
MRRVDAPRGRAFVLAVTGTLGSGKSTVARMFSRLGARVVDADAISREESLPRGRAYPSIVRAFGKGVLARDGTLDRMALARKVFRDAKALRTLEGIIHPLVRQRMLQEIRSAPRQALVVLDVPLLFETGMERFADKVCVVYAPRAVSAARRRDVLRRQRIRVQMPVKEKLSRADFIIDNAGTMSRTRTQVKQLWQMCARRK